MSTDTQNSTWPLPKFYFSVTGFPGSQVIFQEVTGLDSSSDPIKYRAGDSSVFPTIKMPGIAKSSHVTLKKGIFVRDATFWTWFNSIKMNTIARMNLVINLLDETGSPTMTWTLNNAFPTKIIVAEVKTDDHCLAVESLELAYETLTVSAN